MLLALLIVAAYLCGSLPTGEWFARRAGVDVRGAGSGNIGATNVARTAGARAALLTLIADIGKGFVPALISAYTRGDQSRPVLVGLAAFLGHIFPVFSRFAGGKGVAPAFGIFLYVAPAAAATALVVFLAAALWTQYVSLASMLGALTVPISSAAFGYSPAVWLAGFVAAGIIIVRHRENIARLRQGQEPKFRFASRS